MQPSQPASQPQMDSQPAPEPAPSESFPRAFDYFTRAYVTAALWSSVDDDGEPLDQKYSDDDIAPDSMERMRAECRAFFDAHCLTFGECLLSNGECTDDERAGHDFWLTRAGHGTGFWDTGRWSAAASQRLTDASRKAGSRDLVIGDDGQIHHEPA